jgi:rubredoxin
VSDLAKREGTLACPRCKAPMKDVVWIAPVQSDPGLIAYECPSCGYLTSVLIATQSGDQSKGGQST